MPAQNAAQTRRMAAAVSASRCHVSRYFSASHAAGQKVICYFFHDGKITKLADYAQHRISYAYFKHLALSQ